MSGIDWDKWVRRAGWTLEESAALLLGLDPKRPIPAGIAAFGELRDEIRIAVRMGLFKGQIQNSYPADIARLHEAVRVAKHTSMFNGRFQNVRLDDEMIPPADVLAWAEQTGITVPADLAEAASRATGRPMLADLQAENEQLRAQLAAATAPADDDKPSAQKTKKLDSVSLVLALVSSSVADSHRNTCRHADESMNYSGMATWVLDRVEGVPKDLSHENIRKMFSAADEKLRDAVGREKITMKVPKKPD